MVLIKLFLFYFSIEFSKHLINCDPDSANEQAISNDLVFDLRNLKTEDYHIFKSNRTIVSYRFIPIDPKIITEVIINDEIVWKRNNEDLIEKIVVFVAYKLPHTYELNIIDKNGSEYRIHFHYFDTLRNIGMIEFLNLNYDSLIFDYNQHPLVFDLKNPFDYVYHITQEFESLNSGLKIIEVVPRTGSFIDIYENKSKVTDLDKSIRNFELSTNAKKFLLLKLNLDTSPTDNLYYKCHENRWHLIDQNEYIIIFEENNLEFAETPDFYKSIGFESSINVNINRNSTESVKITNEKLMLIPTNIYKFKFLESLFESNKQVFSNNYYDGVIYVFRDPLGFKMIEVVHSSKEDQTRKPNIYYIKEGDVWKETKQDLVYRKLMEQTVSILKEKGAPPELLQTIENLHIFGNKDSEYMFNLDIPSTFILPEIKIMPPKEGTQDNNDQPQDNKDNKENKENKDNNENNDKPINPDLNDQPQNNKENKENKDNNENNDNSGVKPTLNLNVNEMTKINGSKDGKLNSENGDSKNNKSKEKTSDFYTISIPIISSLLFFVIY